MTTPDVFQKVPRIKGTVKNRKRKGRADTLPPDDRAFRVWDGEGVSYLAPEDCKCVVPYHQCLIRQNYVLFGYAQLGKGHEYISTVEPGTYLGTEQCLEYIMEHYDNTVFNVWFGSTYDVDQILRDLSLEHLNLLRESQTNTVYWRDYCITYIPGKRFEVTKDHRKVRIDDVMSFFRKSLVKVCKEYLLPDKYDGWELIEMIEADKDDRANFTYAEVDNRITEYWKLEGDLMCHLMNQFRKALIGGDIHLTSWLGPGAIANYLIDAHNLGEHIKQSWDEMPPGCKEGTTFAYFGGRFESRIIGEIKRLVYVYDICSAYAAALSQMPMLIDGEWFHDTRERWALARNINPWAMYYYEAEESAKYNQYNATLGAFPYRGRLDRVSYGVTGEGWLYGHELLVAIKAGASIYIHESWEWIYNTPGNARVLFDFLPEMYIKRQEYKAAGNPAQYGLKIGMSSLYGKLAQLVGYQPETEDKPFREPPKHHAWYAGQTTAWCRARIMEACLQSPESIVAIETDGIYSLVPLDLPISKALGDWEAEIYEHMVYVQSGVYWYKKQGHKEWEPAKARGLGSGTKGMTGDDAVKAAQTLSDMSTTVHRYGAFTGYRGRAEHGTWFDTTRIVTFDVKKAGKRYHKESECSGCNGTTKYHVLAPSIPTPIFVSYARILPWGEKTSRHQEIESRERKLNTDTDIFYGDFDTINDISTF